MNLSQLEIHNIGHLVSHENGYTWLRIPQNVFDSLESDMGKWMSTNAIGVELRFVIKDGPVKITMQSISSPSVLTTFHVFYGGIQGGWDGHEMDKHIPTTPTEFIFQKPNNLETLRAMTSHAGLDWDPEVVRIIFERGDLKILKIQGEITPPTKEQTPKRTLLTYGSSITHGSNALSISNAWPSVLAHHLNMDLRNLGMAGSCMMEPEMIEYLASEGEKDHWHTAILELGINVLSWSEAKIRERVTNTLRQIAGRNLGKKVYVVSPFYCNDDFYHLGEAQKWRTEIEFVVQELHFPNIQLINGLDLLGDMSLISADEVHPNLYGQQQIADRLRTILLSSQE
ncbi:MAG: SGNH/GDSL hydrolase family protein [Candidatus Izemoplasmatales bacterium]|nr:SGNH/GDSL hydrolase family protein [Candidatus Izemoplasmatales bacterium]